MIKIRFEKNASEIKIPLEVKPEGLYCSQGDFFIDAWQPVHRSIITHAHSDHAKAGHDLYICSEGTKKLLQYRLGIDCPIQTNPISTKFKLNNTWVSFHPAGHILGSVQIRIETQNGVCVVSGDYKRALDPTCEPFEIVKCDTFVTESTFALPIYHWESSAITIQNIYQWWQENAKAGFSSILFCYALGKAQRILSLLKQHTEQPVYAHGAILAISKIYSDAGISLLPVLPISEDRSFKYSKELILAPPLAKGSIWMKKFYPYKTAFASGWMQVRGVRKQRNVDKGFPLSDHADWHDLISTIKETEAKTVLTTHGNAATLAQYLSETGLRSYPLKGTELIEEGEG